ncbi:MAG TPA: hypothetical protein VEK09_09560 [Jatrophihabitantaceae bacterium]|nr:hypothetical protein [Jatrophihabitantaceae bacterium]
MVVVGAFVLLGWIGVALASATNASADTGSGKSTAIDGLLAPAAPLLNQVSTVLGTPAASATHHPSHGHATIARPAHSAPVTKAVSAPSADRHPRSAAAGSNRLPLLPGLADLPGSTASNPGPAGALFDLMMAVAEPVAQVTCSIAPGITRPAGESIKDVGAAVTSIAPVTSLLPIGSLLDLITMPLTGDAPRTSVSGPAPGPGPAGWSNVTPTSTAPRTAHQHAVPLAATSAPFGPTYQSLPAAPSTSRGPYSGSRIPVPAPAPPAVPDLAVTTASGSAATSNPRSGTGVPSGFSSETWSAQQLRLLGAAESTRSRSVRDSATKPPVSPD